MGVLHFNALTASFSGALQLVSFTFCGSKNLYGDSTNSNCIFQFRLPVMYLYIACVNVLKYYISSNTNILFKSFYNFW